MVVCLYDELYFLVSFFVVIIFVCKHTLYGVFFKDTERIKLIKYAPWNFIMHKAHLSFKSPITTTATTAIKAFLDLMVVGVRVRVEL